MNHYYGNKSLEGYTGIFGGGPFYKDPVTTLRELENSGFNEIIVWNIKIGKDGELNFNGEFPLVADGKYIGNTYYPEFTTTLEALKGVQARRITFSIGSAAPGDFKRIKDFINREGTGVTSSLYRNFSALLSAMPFLDAIDLDDEYEYDAHSTTEFSVMLGKMGLHVVPDVYTNKRYWQEVVSSVNSKVPGTVDCVHLQAYAGGAGNDPSDWLFGGDVLTLPGVSSQQGTAENIETIYRDWHQRCAIRGGFFWLYDDVYKNGSASRYAEAINEGIAV